EVAHVALVELGLQPLRRRPHPGPLDVLAGKVDAGHPQPAPGQSERQPAVAAGYVEDLRAGGDVQRPHQKVSLGLRRLLRDGLLPAVEGEALKQVVPPPGTRAHTDSPRSDTLRGSVYVRERRVETAEGRD